MAAAIEVVAIVLYSIIPAVMPTAPTASDGAGSNKCKVMQVKATASDVAGSNKCKVMQVKASAVAIIVMLL